MSSTDGSALRIWDAHSELSAQMKTAVESGAPSSELLKIQSYQSVLATAVQEVQHVKIDALEAQLQAEKAKNALRESEREKAALQDYPRLVLLRRRLLSTQPSHGTDALSLRAPLP